ncbi:hypothetical protein K438DRAFT_1834029 [Mycena galopus ATCC 62051]|nr:hypothetical protein K438DRAFT_1834029 [Mycena galopus ATCC 62051]
MIVPSLFGARRGRRYHRERVRATVEDGRKELGSKDGQVVQIFIAKNAEAPSAGAVFFRPPLDKPPPRFATHSNTVTSTSLLSVDEVDGVGKHRRDGMGDAERWPFWGIFQTSLCRRFVASGKLSRFPLPNFRHGCPGTLRCLKWTALQIKAALLRNFALSTTALIEMGVLGCSGALAIAFKALGSRRCESCDAEGEGGCRGTWEEEAR